VTGEGNSYQQPSEAMMDRADEQRAWTDMTERYHKVNEIGLKQNHFKHLPAATTSLQAPLWE